jgi:hypothetical protein
LRVESWELGVHDFGKTKSALHKQVGIGNQFIAVGSSTPHKLALETEFLYKASLGLARI